jgi:hypothetical protein
VTEIIKHHEWFHIKDRGDVVSFPNPIAGNRKEVYDRYMGKQVMIDGHTYTVKGIELFAVENHPVGRAIGLLLDEPRFASSEKP